MVEGIEFRSVTVTAIKGLNTERLDRGHAVIYRGPFSSVRDDNGQQYPRGVRIAVCEKTFQMLTGTAPYRDQFIGIKPVTEREPRLWCAAAGGVRPPSETKGGSHTTENSGPCCS